MSYVYILVASAGLWSPPRACFVQQHASLSALLCEFNSAIIHSTACLIEALVISNTTAHNIDAHNKLAIIIVVAMLLSPIVHSAGNRR